MSTPMDEGPLAFVDSRLDSILAHPQGWGPVESLEPQILTLLELRLVVTHCGGDVDAVQERYLAHLVAAVGGPSSLPLTERASGEEQVVAVLRGFVDQERQWQQAHRPTVSAPESRVVSDVARPLKLVAEG